MEWRLRMLGLWKIYFDDFDVVWDGMGYLGIT